MAQVTEFKGCNVIMKAPKDTDIVVDAHAFSNGVHCVTKWVFTEEEMAEIVASGSIYVSIMLAGGMPPVYASSESSVREHIADQGVWKK